MKFLSVLTPPQDIYHGCSTHKTLWQDKLTPVNMTSSGRCNVRKHRDTKNGEQYIVLDIYSKIDFMDKREAKSSESRDYMGRPGKGMNTSLTLRTKNPNNKQKARFYITEITNQDFRKFNNSPYIGYKSKQVNNEPTED